MSKRAGDWLHQNRRFLPWVAILAVVIVWLAPITLLGRMPIGGDVTSFFLPLMSYYRRALLAGRIPLWNELWGFGFPMLAESQAGVFYPPHLILYRLFETETAYSINIVLHFVLAGWFAYFCGREFGLRRWGATLTGLVFAGNGFFIIHFPHQWSYTTGCWMPLAVGLAWRAMRGEQGSRGAGERGRGGEAEALRRDADGGAAAARTRRIRAALLLALVLAVQMLAGHFQLAFYTQVVVLLLGLTCTVQRLFAALRTRAGARSRRRVATGERGSPAGSDRLQRSVSASAAVSENRLVPASAPASPSAHAQHGVLSTQYSVRSAFAPCCWVGVPVFGAFVLAAVQLLPTYELIQIALPEGRDFEYLSGFANTPFHLVSYLLPTLFHVNPLWRPVAWDPFHTSPEECFSYVGLLPFCLAVAASWRWRREPRVRLWVLLGVVTLLFSLGPYVPGFTALIRLPGFSGFRSASRWGLATALFLSLLAGRAFDAVQAVARLRAWLFRLTIGLSLVAVLYGAFAFAELGGNRSDQSTLQKAVESCLGFLSPWPEEMTFFHAKAYANGPADDLRAISGLANLGHRVRPKLENAVVLPELGVAIRPFTLAGERTTILLQEFLPVAAAVAVCWACVLFLPRGRRVPRWLLLGLVAADLGAASWLRPTDFAPRGRLLEKSPVLEFLTTHAQGQRVLDSQQNLAMFAGAAPVRSYRTVDIPILESLPWGKTSERLDIRWLVLSGDIARRTRSAGLPPAKTEQQLTDPMFGRMVFGPGLVRAFPDVATRFVIRDPGNPNSTHAWFWATRHDSDALQVLFTHIPWPVSMRGSYLDSWLLETPGELLAQVRADAEVEEFELRATEAGVVIMTALHYPGWEASLKSSAGVQPVEVRSIATGCRAVMIPQSGTYHLELKFRSRAYERGLLISAGALAACGAVMIATLRWRRKMHGATGATTRQMADLSRDRPPA